MQLVFSFFKPKTLPKKIPLTLKLRTGYTTMELTPFFLNDSVFLIFNSKIFVFIFLQLNFEVLIQNLTFALNKELHGSGIVGFLLISLFDPFGPIWIWPLVLVWVNPIPLSLLSYFLQIYSKSKGTFSKKVKKTKVQEELAEIRQEKGIPESKEKDVSLEGKKPNKEKNGYTVFSFPPLYFQTVIYAVIRQTCVSVSYENTVISLTQTRENFKMPLVQSQEALELVEPSEVFENSQQLNVVANVNQNVVPASFTPIEIEPIDQSVVALVPKKAVPSFEGEDLGVYEIPGQAIKDALTESHFQHKRHETWFPRHLKYNPILDATRPFAKPKQTIGLGGKKQKKQLLSDENNTLSIRKEKQIVGTPNFLETNRVAPSLSLETSKKETSVVRMIESGAPLKALKENKNLSLVSKKEINNPNSQRSPKAKSALKVQKVEKTPSNSEGKQKKLSFFQKNEILFKEEKIILKNVNLTQDQILRKKDIYLVDYEKIKNQLNEEKNLLIENIQNSYSKKQLLSPYWTRALNNKVLKVNKQFEKRKVNLEKVYNSLFSMCEKSLKKIEKKARKGKAFS
uniref:hypothetical protein n=1 Tax=Gormaniella terricola TaxID=2904618 RepID=UPI0021CCC759|nr:hypothetical protein ODF01_pgp067 [Gormaniella terricola]UWV18236.1 hypothetical protein [Gormaniella terricola]